LLAALYLFVCLQASIRRSASGITLLAEALRDGNLSLQVPVVGRDELAAISTALNVAVVQLRASMLGVDHETLQLSNAVRTLNHHSSGALSEVEAQQLQISQIAAAATQLAATSQGVARVANRPPAAPNRPSASLPTAAATASAPRRAFSNSTNA
jgi:methyl-accepting chemotaxis protein